MDTLKKTWNWVVTNKWLVLGAAVAAALVTYTQCM